MEKLPQLPFSWLFLTFNSHNVTIKLLNYDIKEKTANAANSLDELIEQFLELKRESDELKREEEQRKPKFTFRTEPENSSSSADFEAIRLSNETARERIYEHLKSLNEYDLTQWTKGTNTIIKNVKKHGITIGLVTKGADNKIIHMNSSERELLSDTTNFSELWVHSHGQIYQITLGEILKIWNVQKNEPPRPRGYGVSLPQGLTRKLLFRHKHRGILFLLKLTCLISLIKLNL